MPLYERSVLILDSSLCELGETSLGLISLGLRPLYATDFEELLLLARERRGQIGALLAPGSLIAEQIEPLCRRLLEPLGLPIECVVPAAKRPDDAQLALLAQAGVRWAAFDPISPRDLRFLLALALSVADANDRRKSPRLPCDLVTRLRAGERTLQARITEISTGGAYLALRAPIAPGTPVSLSVDLPAGALEIPARVVWRTPNEGGGAVWLESGMGVAFREVPEVARAPLAALVAEQVQRYAIRSIQPPPDPRP